MGCCNSSSSDARPSSRLSSSSQRLRDLSVPNDSPSTSLVGAVLPSSPCLPLVPNDGQPSGQIASANTDLQHSATSTALEASEDNNDATPQRDKDATPQRDKDATPQRDAQLPHRNAAPAAAAVPDAVVAVSPPQTVQSALPSEAPSAVAASAGTVVASPPDTPLDVRQTPATGNVALVSPEALQSVPPSEAPSTVAALPGTIAVSPLCTPLAARQSPPLGTLRQASPSLMPLMSTRSSFSFRPVSHCSSGTLAPGSRLIAGPATSFGSECEAGALAPRAESVTLGPRPHRVRATRAPDGFDELSDGLSDSG